MIEVEAFNFPRKALAADGQPLRKVYCLPCSFRSAGFTMVELVVVLVLIGIVSVSIMSRYLTPNVFDAVATREGLITTMRAAQQAALGRSNVSFTIVNLGSEWAFTAKAASAELQTLKVGARNLTLETGTAQTGAGQCSAALDTPIANDFRLSYDSQGNLASFLNNGVTQVVDGSFNGVRICVNDTDEFSVCVSPAGYAYAGNCDD